MKNPFKELGKFINSKTRKKEARKISRDLRAEIEATTMAKAEVCGAVFIYNSVEEGKHDQAAKDLDLLLKTIIKDSFLSGVVNVEGILIEEFNFSEEDIDRITKKLVEYAKDPEYIKLFKIKKEKFFNKMKEEYVKKVDLKGMNLDNLNIH